MQQLHRRKVRELEELTEQPERLQKQIDALQQQPNAARHKSKIEELRKTLQAARNKELLTQYLMDFMPYATEDADIQCEFAMKKREAHDNQERLFELSQETNAKLHDLTRRYKLQFWPNLVNSNDDEPPPAPLDLTVEEAYDVEGMAELKRCTYKRINHFREYLRQQQGKSRVTISPIILDIVRAELKKHHYKPEQCTPQIVRYLLKNLNTIANRSQAHSERKQPGEFCWSLIYEHTPTITVLINPTFRLIDIPPERERLLCHLFEKTEAPFEKFKKLVKKARKNFMSYPYTTYKLCELLGWDEYLPAFSLLKSDDLLILQDSYFKLVCKELNWQFVPTVGRADLRETLGAHLDAN